MGRRPPAAVAEDHALLHHVLATLEGRLTELVSTVRGLTVNGVLRTSLEVMPAGGLVAFDFPIPFAAVAVWNHSNDPITISATSPSTEPTSGVGTFAVIPNTFACVPVTGNMLTIYGVPASAFGLHVSTRPLQPAGGAA